MDRRRRKQSKATTNYESEEVSSIEWEAVTMSEQEEDLIYRMHKLVGDRWAIIAGRIPGRTPEEIERYWIMKHTEGFAAPSTTGRKSKGSSSSGSKKKSSR
ncbi:hypothetical protein MKW94_027954 [Papaver nudicaule]|uniref:Uncharacterized protein n=1 Tax=Papaver nudicaule TaxID=74823 RepID=A0AA41SBT6_PAPNU|nr:hypothetical protein [Papaver nudicaule]